MQQYTLKGLLRLTTILGLLLPFLANIASAQEALGTLIAPTALVKVERAQRRTPQEMQQAETALASTLPSSVEIPFRPTMDPAQYVAAKAAANASAALTATSSVPLPLAAVTETGVNYDGLNELEAGFAFPPDTHGAVGPANFVEVVNSRLSVFDKANPGTVLLSISLSAFFGTSEFVFDPRVVYDQTWRRWVIVATRSPASSTDPVRRFFLAVSTTSNPAGSYFKYRVGFPGTAGDFWDFPQLGMNRDALIITGNIFGTFGPKGAAMIPIAKVFIYSGLGFFGPVFTGLPGTLAPPIVYDGNKKAYLVAANNGIGLYLYRGQNLGIPFLASLVLQAILPIPYGIPPDAPQVGTDYLLSTSDGRFVNVSTQIGDSLWNVHTINFVGFATPQFYEIDTEGGGANTVKQQGLFFESGTSFDFNASIAANGLGEAFVTWSSTDVDASLPHDAQVRFSGRQPVDPLGLIAAGSALFTSPVALTGNFDANFGAQRWGDYSAVSLDPSPGTTVGCGANRRAWIVNEKINSPAVWGSRIGRIGFCD